MINHLLYALSAGLRCKLIKVDGEPYLERYYVGTLFGVTFYLHRFVSADGDRHTHNHPFNSVSFVLAGSYLEDVTTDLSAHGVLSTREHVRWFNRVPSNKFHRIAEVAPGTWTLFIRGPRVRADGRLKGWGFLEQRGGEVFYRPYKPDRADPDAWHKTADRGRAVGREPLQ